MMIPIQRFTSPSITARPADDGALVVDRSGSDWIARRVAPHGVVCVAWQQISVGKHRAGRDVDIHVLEQMLQIWDGQELLKSVLRERKGVIRKKKASILKAG